MIVSGQTGRPTTAQSTQTLGIILGAARFPYSPSIDSPKLSRAFSRSKAAVAKYLNEICDNVLDCFNTKLLPGPLCLKIDKFLKDRPLSTDLIVYYVGHGGFLDSQEYFLALYSTRDNNRRITGLRIADLAGTITDSFRNRRVYVVIDCCFASSAVESFQAAAGDLVNRQAERLPAGIALLNAASRDDAALVPDGALRTMFSDSLVRVLREGIREGEQLLSLRDIGKAVTDLILTKYREIAVRPEVHSPRQRNGDVADFKLFINPGFVAKRRKGTNSTIEKFVTAPQIARLYQFPPELDGTGQCIGILQLGGMPSRSDLTTYCSELGLPAPQLTVVATNTKSAFGGNELMLSAQICCGVAPRARLAFYCAPNTAQGFLDGVNVAVSDRENSPSVLLIPWSSPESRWSTNTMAAMHDSFLTANQFGITVCCPAGGDGTEVNFPASSPYVLACGATSLKAENGSRIDEVAWGDGGGGFSTAFPKCSGAQ